MYRFKAYPEVGYDCSKSTVGREFQVHSNLPSRQCQFSWYTVFPLTQSLSKEDKGVLDLCLPDSLMRKLSVFNFIQAEAFLFAIPVFTTTPAVAFREITGYTASCMLVTKAVWDF